MIAAGHAPADVWAYSPRQIAGFVTLASLRRRRELGEQMAVMAMASRAEPRELRKQLRELGG